MELRHLRYFVAVADEQNFGRAAASLFISQSTLSEQIRSLEREVGGPLLLRTSRRLEMTAAGELLLPEARRALAQTDRALSLVKSATAGDVGSLRIGFSGVAALSGILRADLTAFRSAHPQVEIELVEAAPSALARDLLDGGIDVAYSPELGAIEGLVTIRRAVIRPIVAVPDGHPLAGRDVVRLEDISREPLIAFASEHDKWAAELLHGIAPERLRKASSTLGVLALVSAGAGVAIVPSVLTCIQMAGVSYVPLDVAGVRFVSISIRRGQPAATVRELLRVSGSLGTEV